MASTATGRLIVRNSLYSVFTWVLPIAGTLIVTPFLVRTLGAERYGLYAALLTLMSYSLGFNVGRVAAKYVAEYRAAGREEDSAKAVSSVLWIGLVMSGLSALVIFILAGWLVRSVLAIEIEVQDTATNALYIAGATVVLSVLSQVFQSVLQGLHRFDLYALVTNASLLLLNIGNLTLVLLGYGVVALLIWNLVLVTLNGLIFWTAANRELKDLQLSLAIPKKIWVDSLRYSLSIVGYQALGAALLLFERGWIARRSGTAALAYYIVPMMIAMYFHAFVSNLLNASFPALNESLGDPARLARLYQITLKVALSLSMLFMVSAIAAGHAFLATWLGPEFADHSYQIFVFHAATFAVLAAAVPAWQFIEGYRRAGINTVATAGWVVIGIPLMMLLSQQLGPAGVALGRLAGIVTFVPLLYVAEKQALGRVDAASWARGTLSLLFAGLLTGIVESLVLSLGTNWLTLAAAGCLGCLAFAFGLYLTRFIDEEERSSIRASLWRSRPA